MITFSICLSPLNSCSSLLETLPNRPSSVVLVIYRITLRSCILLFLRRCSTIRKTFLYKYYSTDSYLLFLRLSLTACLSNTDSWLVLVIELEGMIRFYNNDWFIRRLFLILQSSRLFEHLVIDNPVIMYDSAIFAFLACQ